MFTESINNKLKAIYKETTIKNVKACIKKVYKHLNIELVVYNKNDILNNIEKVIEFIETFKTGHAKNYLGYIVKLLSFEDISLKKLNDKLNELYKTDDEERKTNKDKKLVDIDIEAIYKYYYNECFKSAGTYIDKRNKDKSVVRHRCRKPSQTKLNRLVLFSILNNSAIRLTEMCNCLFDDDGVNNYVDYENKQLVIRIHKNKGKTRYVKLSDETIENIKKSQKHIKSKYLFCKKRQGENDISQDVYGLEEMLRVAMKEYNQTHGIDHVAGKFGIHGIRHNAVSKKYAEVGIKVKEIKEILELCDNMGHSARSAIQDYLKTL